jgi:hypothetical protein
MCEDLEDLKVFHLCSVKVTEGYVALSNRLNGREEGKVEELGKEEFVKIHCLEEEFMSNPQVTHPSTPTPTNPATVTTATTTVTGVVELNQSLKQETISESHMDTSQWAMALVVLAILPNLWKSFLFQGLVVRFVFGHHQGK